ncbi:MAG: DUF3147 family protein [Geobacteraceae bacterium]|nr:DUF3147 family protein [Geobacteraceae bacterium]
MQFFLKLLIANVIIVSCALTGRKYPSLSGLVATMPLTSLIVLFWLWNDSGGDSFLLTRYTVGVLWGIIPTILFFAVLYPCFARNISFPVALIIGSCVWLAGALVHQWLLG